MPYLYVLQAPDYAKLGKTIDPRARLKSHAREIGGTVRYTHLWECNDDLYSDVESEAKKLAARFDGITSERLFTSADNLASIIRKAAQHVGAELILTSSNSDAIICNKRIPDDQHLKLRIDARLSREEKLDLESRLKARLGGRSQKDFALEAFRNQLQFEEQDGVVLPDDLLQLVNEYRGRLEAPLRTADIVHKAIEAFVSREKLVRQSQPTPNRPPPPMRHMKSHNNSRAECSDANRKIVLQTVA